MTDSKIRDPAPIFDSADPTPAKAFSLRAFGVGCLGCLAIAVGAPYGNMVIRGSYMAIDFSTAGAIFLFFLLTGVGNAALGILSPRLALKRGELLVAYIMMIVASAIPTMGLSEYLLTIMTAGPYYATPENEWAQLILPWIPEWIAPQNAEAIKWFYEGRPQRPADPLAGVDRAAVLLGVVHRGALFGDDRHHGHPAPAVD